MTIPSMLDKGASARLLEDCWPSSLPAAQQAAPTERTQRWFRSLLGRDAVYQGLSSEGREALARSALEIERRIPMLTGDGDSLPPPHRLYLALEIAKVLFARPRSTLDILASIVVYADAGQLVPGSPEAGVAKVRGRNHVVRELALIESCWRVVERARELATRRRTGQQRSSDARFDELRREVRSWNGALQAGHRVDAAKLVAFAARLQQEIGPHFRELARSLTARLQLPDGQLAALFAPLADGVSARAAVVAAAHHVIDQPNQASIHLSWVAQISMTRTPNRNMLVHELAHVLDFEFGGLDGVASPHGRADGGAAALGERWAAAYDAAVAAPPAYLDPYGLVDRQEFFAVASEHYFSAASALRAHAPELFELLHRTYGYVPADRVPVSGFAVFRTLFLSKLRPSF